jgi:hypothetical protein
VKIGNPRLVQAALGLHNPMPCTWEEGVALAHEQKLFISSPMHGWVLVLGSHLPDPADDVDRCFKLIMALSRKLGHVQFFSVNRVVNHHAWVYAELGRVQRAYAWADRTLWNQGRMTRAEIDLGLTCFAYAEGTARSDFAHPDPVAVNTERLPLLAARWSVDPANLDPRALRSSGGIVGEWSRSKTH